MKNNSKEQFDILQKMYTVALEALMEQSSQLNDVITSLEGKDDCKEARNSLEEIYKNMSDSINKLIHQTSNLVETYHKLGNLCVMYFCD